MTHCLKIRGKCSSRNLIRDWVRLQKQFNHETTNYKRTQGFEGQNYIIIIASCIASLPLKNYQLIVFSLNYKLLEKLKNCILLK